MVSVRSTVHCTEPTVHFFSTHCAFNLVCFIFCVPTVYCTVHPVHCSIIFFLFCVRTTVRTVFKAFPLFIFLFIYFFVNVCCFLLHSVFNIFLVYGTYRTVYCAYGLFYFQFIVQLFYCFFFVVRTYGVLYILHSFASHCSIFFWRMHGVKLYKQYGTFF